MKLNLIIIALLTGTIVGLSQIVKISAYPNRAVPATNHLFLTAAPAGTSGGPTNFNMTAQQMLDWIGPGVTNILFTNTADITVTNRVAFIGTNSLGGINATEAINVFSSQLILSGAATNGYFTNTTDIVFSGNKIAFGTNLFSGSIAGVSGWFTNPPAGTSVVSTNTIIVSGAGSNMWNATYTNKGVMFIPGWNYNGYIFIQSNGPSTNCVIMLSPSGTGNQGWYLRSYNNPSSSGLAYASSAYQAAPGGGTFNNNPGLASWATLSLGINPVPTVWWVTNSSSSASVTNTGVLPLSILAMPVEASSNGLIPTSTNNGQSWYWGTAPVGTSGSISTPLKVTNTFNTGWDHEANFIYGAWDLMTASFGGGVTAHFATGYTNYSPTWNIFSDAALTGGTSLGSAAIVQNYWANVGWNQIGGDNRLFVGVTGAYGTGASKGSIVEFLSKKASGSPVGGGVFCIGMRIDGYNRVMLGGIPYGYHTLYYPALGYLDIRTSKDPSVPAVIFPEPVLATVPVMGGFEFDGTNFWATATNAASGTLIRRRIATMGESGSVTNNF